MYTNDARMDANVAYFMARELERVKSRVYNERYPNLKGRKHFPPGSEPSGPGAAVFTHRIYDSVGMAKVVESYAKDFPSVNVARREFTSRIKSLGDSYEYSFQEVREAMFAQQPLTSDLALAARRAIAELEDSLIYFGSEADGLLGVMNNPNIPIVALPYAVNNTSTADQIIETFNVLINTPIELTNETERVDTVLMPTSVWTYLNSIRIPDSSMSIFKFIQENHKEVEFDSSIRMKGAGTGGADVILAYKRDEQHVYTEIASDFEQLPPNDNGRVTVINCHERFGGVVIPYPLAFAKGELPIAA